MACRGREELEARRGGAGRVGAGPPLKLAGPDQVAALSARSGGDFAGAGGYGAARRQLGAAGRGVRQGQAAAPRLAGGP